MRRHSPLTTDPAQVRAWEARTRHALSRSPMRSRRRETRPGELTPAAWYNACQAARGLYCSVPGCGETRIQMDHLIPRSLGGPYLVANGWPLCAPASHTFRGGHHLAKTEHRLPIPLGWLPADMVEWLAATGHAWWDLTTGEVHGRHRRIFAPVG